MKSDLELAELLDGAPPRAFDLGAPDPGFRFDVFARIALRARRAEARQRAILYAAVFAAIGLAIPLSRAVGFTLADAEPLLAVAAGAGLAYVLALLSSEGPHAVLAHSRRMLRVGL